ncbi:MAG: hypothetical protein LBQ24_02595 [Candidatus Peribacteria bacterium]|nr:hypothetical protein [Candidatus Peribacteria bacterium]
MSKVALFLHFIALNSRIQSIAVSSFELLTICANLISTASSLSHSYNNLSISFCILINQYNLLPAEAQ